MPFYRMRENDYAWTVEADESPGEGWEELPSAGNEPPAPPVEPPAAPEPEPEPEPAPAEPEPAEPTEEPA